MAFAATKTGETIMGNKRVCYGTFTNDTTSGTIATGLGDVEYVECTGATALSASAGTVTATTSSTAGYWVAFGSC